MIYQAMEISQFTPGSIAPKNMMVAHEHGESRTPSSPRRTTRKNLSPHKSLSESDGILEFHQTILTEYEHHIQPRSESKEGQMDEVQYHVEFDNRDDVSSGYYGEMMDDSSHYSPETHAREETSKISKVGVNDSFHFGLDNHDEKDPFWWSAERMLDADCIFSPFRTESPPLQLRLQPNSRMIVDSPGASMSSESRRRQYDSTSNSITSSILTPTSHIHQGGSVKTSTLVGDITSSSSSGSKAAPHDGYIFPSGSLTVAVASVIEGKTLDNEQSREQFISALSEMARTKWPEEDIHGLASSLSSESPSSSPFIFRTVSSSSSHQLINVSSVSSDSQELDAKEVSDLPLVLCSKVTDKQSAYANQENITHTVNSGCLNPVYGRESQIQGESNISSSKPIPDSGNRTPDFKQKCPLSSMVLPMKKGKTSSQVNRDIQAAPLSTQTKYQLASDPSSHQDQTAPATNKDPVGFRRKYSLASILVPSSDVNAATASPSMSSKLSFQSQARLQKAIPNSNEPSIRAHPARLQNAFPDPTELSSRAHPARLQKALPNPTEPSSQAHPVGEKTQAWESTRYAEESFQTDESLQAHRHLHTVSTSSTNPTFQLESKSQSPTVMPKRSHQSSPVPQLRDDAWVLQKEDMLLQRHHATSPQVCLSNLQETLCAPSQTPSPINPTAVRSIEAFGRCASIPVPTKTTDKSLNMQPSLRRHRLSKATRSVRKEITSPKSQSPCHHGEFWSLKTSRGNTCIFSKILKSRQAGRFARHNGHVIATRLVLCLLRIASRRACLQRLSYDYGLPIVYSSPLDTMYVWVLQLMVWMIRGDKFDEHELALQQSLSEELDLLFSDSVGGMVDPVFKAFVWNAFVETNLANYPYIFAHEEVSVVKFEDEDDGMTLEMEKLPGVEAQLRRELEAIHKNSRRINSVVPTALFGGKKIIRGIDDLSSETCDMGKRAPEHARSISTKLTIRHFLETSKTSNNLVAKSLSAAQPVECVPMGQEDSARHGLRMTRGRQDHATDSIVHSPLHGSDAEDMKGSRIASMKLTIRHFVKSNKKVEMRMVHTCSTEADMPIVEEHLLSPEEKHVHVSALGAAGTERVTSPSSQNRFSNQGLFGCVLQNISCHSVFCKPIRRAGGDLSHAQIHGMNPSMNQSANPQTKLFDMDGSTGSSDVRNHLVIVRSEEDCDFLTECKKQSLSPGKQPKKREIPRTLKIFPELVDVSDLSGSSSDWSMEPILPPSPSFEQPVSPHQLDRETFMSDDGVLLPNSPMINHPKMQDEPEKEIRKSNEMLSPMVIPPISQNKPERESRKGIDDALHALSPVVLQATNGNEPVGKAMKSENEIMDSKFSEMVANLVEEAFDGIFTGPLAVLNPEGHAYEAVPQAMSPVYACVFDDGAHRLDASGSSELNTMKQGGGIKIREHCESTPEMRALTIPDGDEFGAIMSENLMDHVTASTSMSEEKNKDLRNPERANLRMPEKANLHDLLFSDSESPDSDVLGMNESLELEPDYGGEEMDFFSRNPVPLRMGSIEDSRKEVEPFHRITEHSLKLGKYPRARALNLISSTDPSIQVSTHQTRNGITRLVQVNPRSSTSVPSTCSPRYDRDVILFSISSEESAETLEELPEQSENVVVWQNTSDVKEDLSRAELVKSPKEISASERHEFNKKDELPSPRQENDKVGINGWVGLPPRKRFHRRPRFGSFERTEDDWEPSFNISRPHQMSRGEPCSLNASEDWDMELDIQAENAWDLRVNVQSTVLEAPSRCTPNDARLEHRSNVKPMLPRKPSNIAHGSVSQKSVLRAVPTPTNTSGWSTSQRGRQDKASRSLKTRGLLTPKQLITNPFQSSSLALRRNRQD